MYTHAPSATTTTMSSTEHARDSSEESGWTKSGKNGLHHWSVPDAPPKLCLYLSPTTNADTLIPSIGSSIELVVDTASRQPSMINCASQISRPLANGSPKVCTRVLKMHVYDWYQKYCNMDKTKRLLPGSSPYPVTPTVGVRGCASIAAAVIGTDSTSRFRSAVW